MWRNFRAAAFMLTTAVCVLNGVTPVASAAPSSSIKDNKKGIIASPQQMPSPERETQNSGYVYVIDQDLSQVLKEFGRRRGVSVQVDAEIKKRIKNQKIPLDKAAFLKFMKDQYDLVAMQNDASIIFSSSSQLTPRMFMLNNVSPQNVIETAKAMGINLQQYSMKIVTSNNSLYLQAPTSVLGKVEAIIQSLAQADSGVTIVKFGREMGVTHESTQNSK